MYVVHDPEDDLAVLRAMRRLSDKREGRALVVPTPGNPGGGVLCHDILEAMGHSRHPEWVRLTRPVHQDTVAVMRPWWNLGALAQDARVDLWLVAQGHRPPRNALWDLHLMGFRVHETDPRADPLTCLPPISDRRCHFRARFGDISSRRAADEQITDAVGDALAVASALHAASDCR